MKILAVSDKIVDWIYSSKIRQIFPDVDVVLGCGDLPIEYLEFIVSSLDIPLYYVNGNHSLGRGVVSTQHSQGSICLHGKATVYRGITFAGIEGSLRYNDGIYQYSQYQMWIFVIKLIPIVLSNRRKYGRFLDVLLTHAPPWGIHDQADLPHQGIKAFRWFIETFRPKYHIHGHIHVYRPDTITITKFRETCVLNAYGYKLINL